MNTFPELKWIAAISRSLVAAYVEYLGDLIAEYEVAHRPKKEMPVPHLLRELMTQQSLKGQSPIFRKWVRRALCLDVLRGKRRLNVRQIAKLANVQLPAEVFMR